MSERTRGDHWADAMRAQLGAWVQKLPSSVTSGIPDWLLVDPYLGNCFVEAKKLRPSGPAFVPDQCSRAQRFFLEAVARHGGEAHILVLGPDRWLMRQVRDIVREIPRKDFEALAVPYPEGWSDAGGAVK